MPIRREHADAALLHLRRADPVLRQVIKQVGPLRLSTDSNRFRMLVRSILSQQLATGAARTIRMRVEALIGDAPFTAEALSKVRPEQLRAAGVSGQKTSYLQDLADAALSGRIQLRGIARKSDEAVIEELIQVKGIGRWTAQMFLIFSLGRLDVFPVDDLGVRSALRKLYGLHELPDKTASHAIASCWSPYASVASWYCWQSLDLKPVASAKSVASNGKKPSKNAQ
ncbi:MAG: DNA-3-methyladenine glycosylase [Planctomycetota bacterium]|nr:DNA-3-methyladenine glycosylase [Planctomycetota bacterium]